MGALHKGHVSLITKAKEENGKVICSIFVNPAQFNDKYDLEKYPRTLEADKKMLVSSGCDILFAPSVEEMYPQPDITQFDFGQLDKLMEGKHRPGHFNGVALVVKKFFDIVEPNSAYFGQKDFQQLTIIKRLVRDFMLSVKIIACPIYRESDGLAMSSRNTLLTSEEREIAPFISQTLFKAKEMSVACSLERLKNWVEDQFKKQASMRLEYFEVVDVQTLKPVEKLEAGKGIVACIAVKLGRIRLIDNIVLFP